MSDFNDLFNDETLDKKMSFLDDKKAVGKDGIYRVDLSKVSDKKSGYKATIRLLPNFTQEGKIGPSAIEKTTHYVDLKQMPDLVGYYDSPKNINPETGQPFEDKCLLTDTYWTMKNSKNAILHEKANALKYSRKYFSYCLVIEDEQQPDLVGKIMVFQYGKTIKDKIAQEKEGEISGEKCNVFNMINGKDLRLIVKEVQDDKGNTMPDYRMCQFKSNPTPISITNKAGELKQVPVEDGKIPTEMQEKIRDFLLSRDVEIDDFAPKALTDEQKQSVNKIIAYLTGRSTGADMNSMENANEDDFSFDEASDSSETKEEDDDFDFDDF